MVVEHADEGRARSPVISPAYLSQEEPEEQDDSYEEAEQRAYRGEDLAETEPQGTRSRASLRWVSVRIRQVMKFASSTVIEYPLASLPTDLQALHLLHSSDNGNTEAISVIGVEKWKM